MMKTRNMRNAILGFLMMIGLVLGATHVGAAMSGTSDQGAKAAYAQATPVSPDATPSPDVTVTPDVTPEPSATAEVTPSPDVTPEPEPTDDEIIQAIIEALVQLLIEILQEILAGL